MTYTIGSLRFGGRIAFNWRDGLGWQWITVELPCKIYITIESP